MGNTNRKIRPKLFQRSLSLRQPKAKKMVDDSSSMTHLPTEENEITNTELCLQDLQRNLFRHEADINRLAETTLAEKSNIDGLVQLLLESTTENGETDSQNEIICRLTKVMKDAADTLKDIQKTSQLPINRLKCSFTDVRCDINRCLEQFGKDVIVDGYSDKQVLEKLPKNLDDFRNKIRKPEGQVERLKQRIAELECSEKALQQRDIQPANTSASVQLFYIHECKTINEMVKELKILLIRKLGTMDFIHCPRAADIDHRKLLIVMCIVSTRTGADAARAIKDIQNPGNAALLIIHITEAHCLPSQISSRHLTDQGFKKLRGIFDMSFMSGNGFFHCDMNERSLNELSSFCKEPAFGEKL